MPDERRTQIETDYDTGFREGYEKGSGEHITLIDDQFVQIPVKDFEELIHLTDEQLVMLTELLSSATMTTMRQQNRFEHEHSKDDPLYPQTMYGYDDHLRKLNALKEVIGQHFAKRVHI